MEKRPLYHTAIRIRAFISLGSQYATLIHLSGDLTP